MVWFSKKDKTPHLQQTPGSSELSFPKSLDQKQLPNLPQFSSENQNQQIKLALASGKKVVITSESLPELPDFTVEEPELIPSILEEKKEEREEIKKPDFKMNTPIANNEPIFIRIDKFEEAKKKLEEIKKSVREIESTLKKVREAKQREELEIMGWSQEIGQIKDKISEIDSDVFDKLR